MALLFVARALPGGTLYAGVNPTETPLEIARFRTAKPTWR
jgi:hypothetical protein